MKKLQKRNSNNNMGLFKSSKDKSKDSKPDKLAPPQSASESTLQNPNPSSSTNNSFNASTASSSNLSSADTRVNVSQQPPGTTVTTTTTTTTTTTVVRSDGTTSVSTSQYNPSTDPPQNSNVIQRPDASAIQMPNYGSDKGSLDDVRSPAAGPVSVPSPVPESPVPIQRQLTGGNRTIPPRSELRNSRTSPPTQAQATYQPGEAGYNPPTTTTGSRRNSQEYVSPIVTTQPQPTFPATQTRNQNQNHIPSQPIELSTSPPAHKESQSQYFNGTPLSPTHHTPTSNTQTPAPNFSRPSAPTPNAAATHDARTTTSHPLTSHPSNPALKTGTTTTTSHPPQPTTTAPAPPAKQHMSLTSTLKGLHGAGEALRGSVNSRIAGVTGETAEVERARQIKEQGLREYRESGIHDRLPEGKQGGFRDRGEQKMHLRRKSVGRDNGVYGSAGPQGLTKVGEVPEERSVY